MIEEVPPRAVIQGTGIKPHSDLLLWFCEQELKRAHEGGGALKTARTVAMSLSNHEVDRLNSVKRLAAAELSPYAQGEAVLLRGLC